MWPLLAVAVASLAAVGAINARLAGLHARQRIERQLRGVVDVLRTSNFPLTAPVLRKMRDLSRAEFTLTDALGAEIASSFPVEIGRLPSEATVSRLKDVSLGSPRSVLGVEYYHTAIRLASPSRGGDSLVLHVLFPRDEYRAAWREAFLPPLVVGILTIAATALVAGLLAGRISRATARLGREVLRLARGDFARFDSPALDDEIRDLSLAINRTAELLADYEQQIRRTEQMRTVGRLGASLAHEIRNAATGCRMAVDLHAESCPEGPDEECLAVARRQLRLMESQLQRFLQIGKRPAEVVSRQVDLSQLIDDLLPLVRPAANHAHVQVQLIPTHEELTVQGDRDSLTQAALNLVLNAIEAVRQQPTADGTRRVIVELRRTEDGNAEFAVSDTGPGPAAAAAPSMFEPFVTSKPEGAGLGLAVVKDIVEAHHGTIAFSRIDGMTRFRITLPAAEKGVCCV
jgi:signal transduction histidine kinase